MASSVILTLLCYYYFCNKTHPTIWSLDSIPFCRRVNSSSFSNRSFFGNISVSPLLLYPQVSSRRKNNSSVLILVQNWESGGGCIFYLLEFTNRLSSRSTKETGEPGGARLRSKREQQNRYSVAGEAAERKRIQKSSSFPGGKETSQVEQTGRESLWNSTDNNNDRESRGLRYA